MTERQKRIFIVADIILALVILLIIAIVAIRQRSRVVEDKPSPRATYKIAPLTERESFQILQLLGSYTSSSDSKKVIAEGKGVLQNLQSNPSSPSKPQNNTQLLQELRKQDAQKNAGLNILNSLR